MRTITVPLALIGPGVKTALLNRCNAAILAGGAQVDAYFQKVIDRLAATDGGKITIPVAILDTTLVNAMKARAALTSDEWKTQFRARILDAQLDDGS